MKNVIVFLASILLTQTLCLGQKNESLVGTYKASHGYGLKLTIKDDGSYQYEDYEGHWHSEGKWSYDGKNIILDSDLPKAIFPVKVSLSPAKEARERINVQLHVPEGKDSEEYFATAYTEYAPGVPIEVFYYRGQQYSAPYRNNVVDGFYFIIEKYPFERKWIGMTPELYMKIPTEIIEINSIKGNDLTVDIFVNDDSLFQYVVFADYKIKKRGNKLVFADPENGYEYVLKKVMAK